MFNENETMTEGESFYMEMHWKQKEKEIGKNLFFDWEFHTTLI